jgi:hypothetical protein
MFDSKVVDGAKPKEKRFVCVCVCVCMPACVRARMYECMSESKTDV